MHLDNVSTFTPRYLTQNLLHALKIMSPPCTVQVGDYISIDSCTESPPPTHHPHDLRSMVSAMR